MSAEKTEPEPQSPRSRLISNVALAVAWIYVAMIFLLAADQQFHWGIFPP
jgi:hypothetical protein